MRTLVWPPSVTAITTRRNGIPAPPVSRKSVWSGERLEIRNVISKPLCVSPEFDSTLTSCTASSTARGTGTATPGPINNWRRTACSAIARARNVEGQRDPQAAPDRIAEGTRIDDAVRVRELPPQLRVTGVSRAEEIAAIALDDAHLVQKREPLRARAEAAAQERNRRLAVAGIPGIDARRRVPARRRERRCRDGARGEQLLQRIGHQPRPSTPRSESCTDVARPARLSLFRR